MYCRFSNNTLHKSLILLVCLSICPTRPVIRYLFLTQTYINKTVQSPPLPLRPRNRPLTNKYWQRRTAYKRVTAATVQIPNKNPSRLVIFVRMSSWKQLQPPPPTSGGLFPGPNTRPGFLCAWVCVCLHNCCQYWLCLCPARAHSAC